MALATFCSPALFIGKYIKKDMNKYILVFSILFLDLLLVRSVHAIEFDSCFVIKVIDEETRRGVPMVELITTSKIRYYTDSNGIICLDEVSLMNQDVHFQIFSHGYQGTKDGLVLRTIPGTRAAIEIKRINIAERLYRITGQDIYGESIRAGLPVPLRRQGLNGKVTGQDTFIETLYKRKLYWFWGDTFGPASFNGYAAGAVSELPENGGLNPETGIDLTYFADSTGLNKGMCDIPGPGLVWIDWLAALPDDSGKERLFAKYTRVQTLETAYERGIAVFDDSAAVFRSVKRIDEWLDKNHSSGHPVLVKANGQPYFYIFDRYGLERVPADHRKIVDSGAYERFTCLEAGSKFSVDAKIEKNEEKRVVYSWMANTDAISTNQQYQLMEAGKLTEGEGWFNPRDIATGERLDLNPASVFWNRYRQRWIMLAYGFCGQVWFLEADTPTGPWVYARKILTHDRYDFYNVGQHPLFDQDGGRIIYFEGTYTTGFSGNSNPTPLYDYNQMMYRLTLDDERLTLPVPVYRLVDSGRAPSYLTGGAVDSLDFWPAVEEILFFALPAGRALENMVGLYLDQSNGRARIMAAPQDKAALGAAPLFYALPVTIDQEGQISGMWNCEVDGYPLPMDLQIEGDKVNAKFDDPSLIFERGVLLEDSLQLIVRDSMEKQTYIFTVHMDSYKLSGRYEVVGTRESGVLTGEKQKNIFSELFSSPATVPLYEYIARTGEYCYSTADSLPDMRRSEKPVCRVWRNPSSVLALDYGVRPVISGE